MLTKFMILVVQAVRPLGPVSEAAVQAADANDACAGLPARRRSARLTFSVSQYPLRVQRSTSNSQPSTFNLPPSTFNLQPSTFNLQPSTFNLQPSTFSAALL
jgi:hypothetical protein